MDGRVVNHSNYVTSYEKETNTRYCIDNNHLYGVICDMWKRKYVDEMSDDNIVSTMKSPIWVCVDHHDHKCNHLLCSNWHIKT